MTRPCYLSFLTLLLVFGAFQGVQKAFATGTDYTNYYYNVGIGTSSYIRAVSDSYIFNNTGKTNITSLRSTNHAVWTTGVGGGLIGPYNFGTFIASSTYGSGSYSVWTSDIADTDISSVFWGVRDGVGDPLGPSKYYRFCFQTTGIDTDLNCANGLSATATLSFIDIWVGSDYTYYPYRSDGVYTIATSSIIITTTNNAVFPGNPIYITAIYTNNADYDTIAWNLLNNTYSQVIVTATSSIPLTPVANYAFQHPFNLGLTGSYSLAGQLQNSSTGSTSNWSNTLNFTLTSTGNATSTGSSSVLFIPETCGSFDFFCQLKNAFLWGLIPSADSLNQFVSLKTQIQNKPPFGYLTILTNNLSNATTTGATAFTLTIPQYLKDFVFDPIKTGLSAILWFVGLVWLYKRLTHIQL